MSSVRRTPVEAGTAGSVLRIVGTAAVLAVLLLRVRSTEFHWGPPLANARELAFRAYYDLVYLTIVSGGFAVGVHLARHRPKVQRVLAALYEVTALTSLVMALVNEKALGVLGRPLTYSWLYYADFLRGIDAYNSMSGLLTQRWLSSAVRESVLLLLASYVVVRGLEWLSRRKALRWLAGAAVPGFCLLVGVGGSLIARAADADSSRVQNPVVALIASALFTGEHPLLTTMQTSVPPTDFLPAGERTASEGAVGIALRERARAAGVRNVLIVVLESVGASYLNAYGAPYEATPRLDGYRSQARLFTRAYAHVPSTMHSLTSLLLSVYHPHSFRILTREYPEVRLTSLGSELARRRYRTAFFNSADNRFQRGDAFLRAHGFEVLEDYRSYVCAGKVFKGSTRTWPLLDGTADDCALKRVAEWVTNEPGAPFFAVCWTMQTHFPYFLTGLPRDLGVGDSVMNRYLNALSETDRALGDLLAALDHRHVLDSTLVVVVGDHGEAFGRHGHHVHEGLYEEEVHVPLMLINRRLFHGEMDSTIGGIIDIAPTIMDLLGYALPESWQGRSLFDEDRTGRVYLFAPFSTVRFGFREGARTFIYDASFNTTELYDVEADPEESHNLTKSFPGVAVLGRQRLATWAQYQQRFFDAVLAPKVRSPVTLSPYRRSPASPFGPGR